MTENLTVPVVPEFKTDIIRPEAIDFAKNWIADLRSGNYEQGTGKLHRVYGDEQQFCCLGVACKRIFDDRLIPGFNHEIDNRLNEYYGIPSGTYDDPDRIPGTGLMSAVLLPEPASEYIFGRVTDPRIYMNRAEFEEFKKSDLGLTMVPDTNNIRTMPLWRHGYSRSDYGTGKTVYEFSLMSLNDSGVPFTVIADMIEKFMLPTV